MFFFLVPLNVYLNGFLADFCLFVSRGRFVLLWISLLELLLLCSIDFRQLYFHVHLPQSILFLISLISSFTYWLFLSMSFSLFSFFLFSCSLLVCTVMVGKDSWYGFDFIKYISRDLFYSLICVLFWRMFLMHLKRMCSLLNSDGVFRINLWRQSGLI